MFKITVVFVLLSGIMGSSFGLILPDKSSVMMQEILTEVKGRHPEIFQWYGRLVERVKSSAEVPKEDLDEVRAVLELVQYRIYEFVTSPMYTHITNNLIEQAVTLATPIIQVVPLREAKDLVKILKRDKVLVKTVHQIQEELQAVEADHVQQAVESIAAEAIGDVVYKVHTLMKDLEIDVESGIKK